MKITLQESALKDLKKLDRSTADKILLRIQNLEDYPDLTNIKKLKNHTPPCVIESAITACYLI